MRTCNKQRLMCPKSEALATDANVILESLNPSLFPGVPSSVEAHSGFAGEQAKSVPFCISTHDSAEGNRNRTATQILSAVQTAIAQHSATRVTIVGHSLGAAIALLDGIYLPLHISGVTFRTIGYGTPRVSPPVLRVRKRFLRNAQVGNQAFADYVDSHISFTHINNKKDIVPILPGTIRP